MKVPCKYLLYAYVEKQDFSGVGFARGWGMPDSVSKTICVLAMLE